MKYFTKKIIAVLLTVMLCGITVLCVPKQKTVNASQKFKIHYIDVGAGDGALLQYGEGTSAKYALIDAGPYTYETTDKKTIDVSDRVHQYLLSHGVKHLEFVLLTHPHTDHIAGMKNILKDKSITIDTIYGNPLEFRYLESSDDKEKQSEETARWTSFDSKTYETLKERLNKRNASKNEALHIKYVVPTEGQTIKLGEAKITFYGPLKNDYKYGRSMDAPDLNTRQENKYSIVTRIVYGNNSFLMTGDAQKETIQKIVKKGYNLKAQVLKQPHHGYQDVRLKDKPKNSYVYNSDHKYLIDRTGASIVVISNGYKNVNRTPESNVLRDLSGKNVYQTSDKGTIVVSSDGNKLSVSTQKGGNSPSHGGFISSTKTTPLMQKITVRANTKKKMTAQADSSITSYKDYERKNITVKISAKARSFTNLKQIQTKFVKKGASKGSVSYKNGTTVSIKDGMAGRIYVRFVTDAGADEIKLPGVVVDKKVPTKAKIKANRSGIKTLKTSAKTSYGKKIKKSAKFVFTASYGISGKSKTQYKIVPKGKKVSKCKWKTANKVTFKKKNERVSIYVRFIDNAGNITQRKTNGFYVTK